MKSILLVLSIWLGACLEFGLRPLWHFDMPYSVYGPHLVMVVLAFVALKSQVSWLPLVAAVMVGLWWDAHAISSPALLGPGVCGSLVAMGMLRLWRVRIGDSVLSVALGATLATLVCAVVVLGLVVARTVSLPMLPAVAGATRPSLVHALIGIGIDVGATALLAIPLAALLRLNQPLWGMTREVVERRF